MNSIEIRIGKKERGQISADGCRCLKVGGEERERGRRGAWRRKREEGLGMKGMAERGEEGNVREGEGLGKREEGLGRNRIAKGEGESREKEGRGGFGEKRDGRGGRKGEQGKRERKVSGGKG